MCSVAPSYYSDSHRAGAKSDGMKGSPADFRIARIVTAKPDEKRVRLEPATATDGMRPESGTRADTGCGNNGAITRH